MQHCLATVSEDRLDARRKAIVAVFVVLAIEAQGILVARYAPRPSNGSGGAIRRAEATSGQLATAGVAN